MYDDAHRDPGSTLRQLIYLWKHFIWILLVLPSMWMNGKLEMEGDLGDRNPNENFPQFLRTHATRYYISNI